MDNIIKIRTNHKSLHESARYPQPQYMFQQPPMMPQYQPYPYHQQMMMPPMMPPIMPYQNMNMPPYQQPQQPPNVRPNN